MCIRSIPAFWFIMNIVCFQKQVFSFVTFVIDFSKSGSREELCKHWFTLLLWFASCMEVLVYYSWQKKNLYTDSCWHSISFSLQPASLLHWASWEMNRLLVQEALLFVLAAWWEKKCLNYFLSSTESSKVFLSWGCSYAWKYESMLMEVKYLIT